MYFFKIVINVFVGTSVVSITVARYRFLVTTPAPMGMVAVPGFDGNGFNGSGGSVGNGGMQM
jgi:hypothetical protein